MYIILYYETKKEYRHRKDTSVYINLNDYSGEGD